MKNKKIIFFTARYCGKCFAIRKRVKHLIEENKFNINHEFVDIEENLKLVKKFKVDGVPTTIILENDNEIKRLSGSLYIEDLISLTE